MYDIDQFRRIIMMKPLPIIKIKKGLNIFTQLDPSETQHSRILHSLLDTKGKHGCGKLFLGLFFEYVIDDENFQYGGDEWVVTVETGRYDVSIRNKKGTKIVIIENKSNYAEDQKNQLYRYWFRGIYLPQCKNEKRGEGDCFYKILYVSPSRDKSWDEQSISRPEEEGERSKKYPPEYDKVPESVLKLVIYKEKIADWLSACMVELPENCDMYYYLKQYKEFWRNGMAEDLVRQVEDSFDKVQQWDSFLELSKQKEEIRKIWWQGFKEKLNQYSLENPIDCWDYISIGISEFRWFLKGFKHDSLCLRFRPRENNTDHYALLLQTGGGNITLIHEMLDQPEYLPLKNAFDADADVEYLLPPHSAPVVEDIKFKFNDQEAAYYDSYQLAWFAHYQPDELLKQMVAKIDKFRKDPKLTDLLWQINDKAKK
jgi:hypothetical protein